jgi:adenylate cyclase
VAEQRGPRHARLLVADDNKVNRLLLGRTLQLEGHQVEAVENGRLALEALRSKPFDLLLLDMEMPELDGFAVLEALHGDAELRDLPVIVTSSLEGVAHVARCITLGADDFLHKPVNPVLLKARVASSLEKKQLRDEHKALLRRFATSAVAQHLQQSGFSLAGQRLRATVMFADIRHFTQFVENEAPEEVIDTLNSYYTLMFDAINGQGGVVNQMIGDGLMAIFGAPQALAQPEAAAVLAALDMQALMAGFNAERQAVGKPALAFGIGIATGEVVAGYTGTHERATYTCVGDTVNLAARMEAHTRHTLAAGQGVLVCGQTAAALGSSVPLQALGPVAFKGKAEAVEVFAVLG